MNRTLNVSTPLGAEVLRLDGLQGRESLSQLFDFQLTLKSEEKGIPAQSLLGQPITVDVEVDGGARRYLNGPCVQFRSVGRRGKQHLYVANLKPWLWYATRRSDYRIFQNVSTPDIIRQVLAAYPFPTHWLLSRSYRQWTYCTQYRESFIRPAPLPWRTTLRQNRAVVAKDDPVSGQCTPARAQRPVQKETNSLKPPQNMRFPSKGMVDGSIFRRGSLITALLMRSRSLRDLYTIQENTTTSPSLSLTAWGNDVHLPGFTSSAMHSWYPSAPCSIQILPALRASLR
jgi:hypothetical protein